MFTQLLTLSPVKRLQPSKILSISHAPVKFGLGKNNLFQLEDKRIFQCKCNTNLLVLHVMLHLPASTLLRLFVVQLTWGQGIDLCKKKKKSYRSCNHPSLVFFSLFTVLSSQTAIWPTNSHSPWSTALKLRLFTWTRLPFSLSTVGRGRALIFITTTSSPHVGYPHFWQLHQIVSNISSSAFSAKRLIKNRKRVYHPSENWAL